MAEGQGYIGRSPGDSSVIIADQTFEPTGIQTNFTFASGYDPGYIDVYLNGARLIYANDYTATDGSTVALVDSASNGDVLECVAYKAFNVATIDSAPGNLTVGNKLTVSGVTTATSAYYTGIVTASSFSGDGSGLTGVASTDNIITGVAVTIGGILRVTDTTQSTSSTTGAVIVSGGVGIAKSLHVGGNVSVGGTLTYEDVTNQDVLGLSTFRSGVQFGVAGVGGTIDGVGNAILSGITTVGTALSFADNVRAKFGNSGDLSIYHDASHSFISDSGTGGIKVLASDVYIKNASDADMIHAQSGGAVKIYHNGNQKFETTSSGTITTGIHTVTVGTDLDGYKVEEGSYDTNALNGEFDFELENGHIQTHTGSTAGTYFPDFRVSSSQSLSSVMDVGDVVTATLIVTASNASHYCTAGIKIDNSTSNVTVEWIGSSAASAGKGAGYDIYTFTIQKTAATPAYLVIVNATDAG